MEIDLKEFILSGDFGGISSQTTRKELEATFGEPSCTGGTSRKYPRPVIWKYGDVEFHFNQYWRDESGWHEGQLTLVCADGFKGLLKGGSDLVIEPWIVRGGLPLDEFKAEIEKLGLHPTIETDDSQNITTLKFDSQVTVIFINEPEDHSPPSGLWWIGRRFTTP